MIHLYSWKFDIRLTGQEGVHLVASRNLITLFTYSKEEATGPTYEPVQFTGCMGNYRHDQNV